MKAKGTKINYLLITTGSLKQDMLRDLVLLARAHSPRMLVMDEAQTQEKSEDILVMM